MKKYLMIASAVVWLIQGACASLPSKRCLAADRVAREAGLEKMLVKTDPFVLTAYYRLGKQGGTLHIYIEGDGYAWVTPRRISGDPTPRTPMVLSLAAGDSAANVVYLARPCQYTDEKLNSRCEAFYWTKGRFSEPVVSSINQAISYFAEKVKAPGVDLIGYSGGAAVAVLAAARRRDVVSLRTLAGNLHPDLVNDYHGVSALEGSRDPFEEAPKISHVPMRHFIGTNDKVIPSSVARGFAEKTGDTTHQSITEVKGAAHSEGWRGQWQELLLLPLYRSGDSKAPGP